MTQIRETIENLCVVLKYNGISEITAETFRLAKFDSPEAIRPMWNSLRNTLIWLEGTHLQGKIHSSEGSAALVRFCKHEMFTKGYRVRSFFVLSENMSNGSREVLLCIGWLIAKEKVIQKFINQVQSVITEDLPDMDDLSCAGIQIPDFPESPKTASKSLNELLVSTLQEVVVLKGKLHSASRSLLAARNEYGTLLKKIHLATIPFPVKATSCHLSALDVYLLYHPKELDHYQDKLEMENTYLHSLLVLREKEDLFWKWLESVLDLQNKNNCEKSDNSDDEECLVLNQESYRPSKHTQNIKTKQVEISRHLQEKEKLYQQASKKWKRYREVVEKSKEMQEQFQTLLACLDQEVLEELDKLYNVETDVSFNTNFTSTSLDTSQGTLQLLTPLTPQHKKRSKVSSHTEESVLLKHVKELQEKDKVLKDELRKIKNENCNKITTVALTMDEMVCIPPK